MLLTKYGTKALVYGACIQSKVKWNVWKPTDEYHNKVVLNGHEE